MALNEALFKDRQGSVDRRKTEGFANILFVELGKALGHVTRAIAGSDFRREKGDVASGTVDMRRAEELNKIANGIQKAISEGLPRLPYLASKNYPESKISALMESFIKDVEARLENFYNNILEKPEKYPTSKEVLASYINFVEMISEDFERIIGIKLKGVAVETAKAA